MARTHVPLDRLGVPFEDFAAMFDEASRRYRTQPENNYVAGVLAALAWIANIRPEDPIT